MKRIITTVLAVVAVGIGVGCEPVTTPSPAPKTTSTSSPTISTSPPTISVEKSKMECKVTRVVDGDTVHLACGSVPDVAARLIGIDTPETKDPRKPVQCYGPEASAEAKRLLLGKTVKVGSDFSQGSRDKYERLLVYIEVDGKDYGTQMIANGFAREYTYDQPYKLQSRYRHAEELAKSNHDGLWKACPQTPALNAPAFSKAAMATASTTYRIYETWRFRTGKVCIADHDWKRWPMTTIAAQWSQSPDVDVVRSPDCAGYARNQMIYISTYRDSSAGAACARTGSANDQYTWAYVYFADGTRQAAWVSDYMTVWVNLDAIAKYPSCSQAHVMAHEVGHALGEHHPEQNDGTGWKPWPVNSVMYSWSFAGPASWDISKVTDRY